MVVDSVAGVTDSPAGVTDPPEDVTAPARRAAAPPGSSPRVRVASGDAAEREAVLV